MSLLDRAIALAALAHAGQVDKIGEPYILHPLRVMLACQTEDQRVVAVLHDVLEDCADSEIEVRALLLNRPDLFEALLSVTARDGEGYAEFVARANKDPIGRVVKLADVRDNLDPVRSAYLYQPERVSKLLNYQNAERVLAQPI